MIAAPISDAGLSLLHERRWVTIELRIFPILFRCRHLSGLLRLLEALLGHAQCVPSRGLYVPTCTLDMLRLVYGRL